MSLLKKYYSNNIIDLNNPKRPSEKGKPWETVGRKAKGLNHIFDMDGSRLPQGIIVS